MKLLFVGVACTDEAIKQSNKKYYNDKAAVRPQQYFDLSLVRGLSEYSNVIAISEPPVASYPRSKCLWYKRKEDVVSEKLIIKYIKLLNLLGIKTFIIMFTVFFETFKFCIENKEKKSAILLGYLSFYTSFPAMIVSKIFKVKVFVIVPDIPQYVSNYSKTNNIIKHYLIKLSERFNKLTESRFDGYIFLTRYMNELLNRNKKPYIVMEGFVNKEDMISVEAMHKESKKILMYAGTLHEKFGVKKLVEAFKLINMDNCELWIYGEGDYLKKIQEECVIHSNIKYKGIKNKEEILKLERVVTLLVNPRPSDEEFTKYSFPSKTVEYMASGTPVLTTKLPGIPEEYFQYVYTFEGEDVVEMTNIIQKILSLPEAELSHFGLKAKEFVLQNKNHSIQAKKIINFIFNR
ncbi:MAG: glycosyltransferase [Bacillota bacterium]